MKYVMIISTALELIKAMEQFMPESSGKEKLQAVLAALEGLFGQLPTITPIINTFVATLHATNVFTRKSTLTPGA